MMTKSEFERNVMQPLAKELGYKIMFSGKEAEALGMKLGGYNGRAWMNRGSCIIKWHKEYYRNFQCLFHEIAHLAMHKGFKLGRNMKEVEAESVAKLVCEMLSMPYASGFEKNPSTDYIKHYHDKYKANCKSHGWMPKEPRYKLIVEVAERIVRALVKTSSNVA